MNKWFECKVSYEKRPEEGMATKVTESYLVDASSCTAVEAYITKELAGFIANGELIINTIKRVRVSEVLTSGDDEDDRFYRCKVSYPTFSERTGCERVMADVMYIQSYSLERALFRLKEVARLYQYVYSVVGIQEMPIVGVIASN